MAMTGPVLLAWDLSLTMCLRGRDSSVYEREGETGVCMREREIQGKRKSQPWREKEVNKEEREAGREEEEDR